MAYIIVETAKKNRKAKSPYKFIDHRTIKPGEKCLCFYDFNGWRSHTIPKKDAIKLLNNLIKELKQ